MFILIVAALAADVSPRSVALQAYSDCVAATARAWSEGPDGADVIADAADYHCSAERERARRATGADEAGPSVALFDAYVAGTRKTALVSIVAARSRRSAR